MLSTILNNFNVQIHDPLNFLHIEFLVCVSNKLFFHLHKSPIPMISWALLPTVFALCPELLHTHPLLTDCMKNPILKDL